LVSTKLKGTHGCAVRLGEDGLCRICREYNMDTCSLKLPKGQEVMAEVWNMITCDFQPRTSRARERG
jgi:hypothetical protein